MYGERGSSDGVSGGLILGETHDKVIYVPTEAGLPILEAGKR